MVASKDVQRTSCQPRGSGWFISTERGNAEREIDIDGVTFSVGPKGVSKNIVALARRWGAKAYLPGQTAGDLVRAIAKAHKGQLGGAQGLRLDLADETEFPALGVSPMVDIKHSSPRMDYWFATPRSERKHKTRPAGTPALPKEYVKIFSDPTRGPDNNPNPTFASSLTPEALGMDESEHADFMASGLGPKEYKSLGKLFRALMRRIDTLRATKQGEDLARGLQDVALDAATIAQFSPSVGLPYSFGERLWGMFSDSMWHQKYSTKDVISDAYDNGVIGENYGVDAVDLLRRVNPDLVWNYTGKQTPQEAARKAERAVIAAAQGYLKDLGYLQQADIDSAIEALAQDFEDPKYPVSEESDVPAETQPQDCESSSAGEEETTDREQENLLITSSDGDSSESQAAQRSHLWREACANALTAHDRQRRRSAQLEKEKKAKRGGALIDKQLHLEKLEALGEADGLREYEKQQAEEARQLHEEADRYSGFDPKRVLTFKNRNGYMVMRPVNTGIVVDEAYAKGAHLFGWIAEVASPKVNGSCFIPVDKLKVVKSKYWAALTEPAKTAMLQSLVGEKWPYMPSLYIGNVVDVERRAYDIAFDADGNGCLELRPTTTSSTFDASGNKMVKRLLMPDPNYRKDERAFQLLPLDDTRMAALFPICREELEKMMAKRLTSRFKAENWIANPPADSPWYQLYGTNSWEAEPISGPEGVTGFFRAYAEKVIAVKTTLTGPEKKQWRDTADKIDLMSPDDILAKLRHYIRQETHGFIKNELYGKDSTTLRLIISPALFVKIVFGAVVKRVEERLYSNDPSIPLTGHHIKHMALCNAEETFTSWQRNDEGKYFETDYSAYESSQNGEALAKEFELLKSYYVPDGLADSILNTVLSEMLSGRVVARNKNFRIQLPVMRWSGMPDTACGNLLMNYYNLVVNCGLDPNGDFLLEGDDGIMWGPQGLGAELSQRSAFPLTLDSSEDYSALSFCGLHYCGNAHLPADENLAVARLLTYFGPSELSVQKRYELLYMRLVSYQLLYPKWPALDLIIQQAERYYHDVAKKEISEATIRRWFADQGWWMNQMLGDFSIDDIVKPGTNYAFVHLCCETLDQVRKHGRSRQLARSDAMMDRLLPEYAGMRPNEILHVTQTLLSVAGPLAGVALLCSGHKKAAVMAMVTAASAASAIQSINRMANNDTEPEPRSSVTGTLDRVWAAMTQSIVSMFSSAKF